MAPAEALLPLTDRSKDDAMTATHPLTLTPDLRGAVLAATLPVGVAASLGLALFTILLQESVERAYGRGPTTTLALLGALAVDIGLLWLLANHWLAPSIATDAGLQEAVRRLLGVYRTSDVFPGVLLACGCLVLAAAVFSAQRLGPTPPREGTP